MSSTSLSEKAYQHIRRQVFSGDLKPGDQLVNRSLAKELGTSFIPVREAISRLASEGIVEQVAGAGAFVRTFDWQAVSEIYDVRILFEPFAAGQAARLMSDHEIAELKALMGEWAELGDSILARKRGATRSDQDRWSIINERFHELMITASRNRFLLKMTNDLQMLSQCFAAHRTAPRLLTEDLVQSTIQSHKELIHHFENRDSDKAEALVREQIAYGRRTVLGFLYKDQKNQSHA